MSRSAPTPEERARFICTTATPWSESLGTAGGVEHPDSEDLGDRDFGDGEYCEKHRCRVCGKTYYVELPQ